MAVFSSGICKLILVPAHTLFSP